MYRAVAWEALRQGIDLEDEAALSSLIDATKIDFREGGGNTRTYIGGRDVSDEIRSPEASQASSIISTFEGVRKRLVAMQREMGRRNERGAVIEGRDIGTVVFPDADIKFYLDSSIAERAKRRQMDLLRSGVTVDLSETVREFQIRDDRDSQRRLSPLKPAADSTLIDSTRLKLEEVVDLMLNRIRSALQEREG
jgi:cytidylate kinase